MNNHSALFRTMLFILLCIICLFNISFSQVPTINWTALSNPQYANGSLDMACGKSGSTTTIYYCTNNGFYKTTNDGSNWTQITTITPIPKLVACDLSQPDIVYIADGSSYLKKSTNGGSTWTSIIGTITNLSISRITTAPAPDNQLIFIGCNISGNNTTTWRSTNGGSLWSPINSTYLKTLGITKIIVSPADHNLVFMSASTPSSSTKIGIWKSQDKGITFTLKLHNAWGLDIQRPTGLAIDPTGAILFESTPNGFYTDLNSIFKSTDAGENWTGQTQISKEGQCHIREITDMIVTNSNVYLSRDGENWPSGIYMSDLNGVNWEIVPNIVES